MAAGYLTKGKHDGKLTLIDVIASMLTILETRARDARGPSVFILHDFDSC